MLIGRYNKSVILTYLGVAAAVTAIFTAINKPADMHIAIVLLLFAGLCDMFDGLVARKCKRDEEAKEFGVQIDSLSDMVGFVFLPVVIFIKMGHREWYDIAIAIAFVLGGIIRLGYFNLGATTDAPVPFYRGLPVTTTALLVPMLWCSQFFINNNYDFRIIHSVFMAAVALLFVLNFRIKKPHTILPLAIMGLFGAGLVVLVLWLGLK